MQIGPQKSALSDPEFLKQVSISNPHLPFQSSTSMPIITSYTQQVTVNDDCATRPHWKELLIILHMKTS